MKPNNNIEYTYIIEMPKWERNPVKKAKNRQPLKLEDGLKRFNGLWLNENGIFKMRTLGHFLFWIIQSLFIRKIFSGFLIVGLFH